MGVVELSESILDSMDLGYKIPMKDLQDIGMETEENFYDRYLVDIETISENTEEPNVMDYQNDNFRVLHSVLGDLQSDDGVNLGRLTYHIVDIGVYGKLLGVILDLEVVPTDSNFIEEYKLETTYVTILNRSSYTNYLMVVEDESDIS